MSHFEEHERDAWQPMRRTSERQKLLEKVKEAREALDAGTKERELDD
jgi:hypothetical protein